LKHRRSSISQGELTNNTKGSLMSWGCSIQTSELLERNVGYIPGQSSWSDRVPLSLESQKYCYSLMIGRCKDILIALDMSLEWLRHSVQSFCTVPSNKSIQSDEFQHIMHWLTWLSSRPSILSHLPACIYMHCTCDL